jgi:hypothetical protein
MTSNFHLPNSRAECVWIVRLERLALHLASPESKGIYKTATNGMTICHLFKSE